MINYHLLSKISGFDSNFRKEIESMIKLRFERVNRDVIKLVTEERWSAAYLYMKDYLHDIQPYTQPSFVNGLVNLLDEFRSSSLAEERSMHMKTLLSTIRRSLSENISASTPTPVQVASE